MCPGGSMRNVISASILVWLSGSALAYSVVIPQVAHGPHWKTTVRILNCSEEFVDLTASLYRADGKHWTTHGFIEHFGNATNPDSVGRIQFGLIPWTVREIVTSLRPGVPDDGTDHTGYLVFGVDDILKGKVLITAFLTYYPDGTQPSTQVGLFPSELYTNMSFPVDIDTAVCLTNPTSQRVVVWVELSIFDASGNRRIYNNQLSIEPRRQQAYFLKEIVKPGPALKEVDYFGWVQFYTEGGIVTFAGLPLVFRPNGMMTSVAFRGNDEAW